MRNAPSRLNALIYHGLRETEARVYLALLDHPSLGAAALVEAAGVPRSHLYKVLQDLHAYGLVEILVREDARVYRARPFAVYLERRARELQERIEKTQADASTIGPALVPPPLTDERAAAGDVRLVVGRRSVWREVDQLLAGTTVEAIVASSDGGAARIARHLVSACRSWAERGARPRVILILPPGAQLDATLASAMERCDVEIRAFGMSRPMMSFVGDRARMVLVHPLPDDSDVSTGRDLAIYVDDAAFVEGHGSLLLASSRVADVGQAATGSPSP